MRRDLEAWPEDAGVERSGEAGMTRRGFLAAAGLGAAILAGGGIAWRVAPWQDWLGAAGDANLRIDCDRQDPFAGYVASLTAALPDPGSVHYGCGGHDGDFFRKVAPAEARFIGRALG
jgi:hypothetical protein